MLSDYPSIALLCLPSIVSIAKFDPEPVTESDDARQAHRRQGGNCPRRTEEEKVNCQNNCRHGMEPKIWRLFEYKGRCSIGYYIDLTCQRGGKYRPVR